MGRVLTNDVALAFAVGDPTALDTIPVAGWRSLEPNSLGAIGATISTIVRNPISKSRQRKKGTTTDLDSSVEFEHDITYDAMRDLLPGFMFAKGVNDDFMDVRITSVSNIGDPSINALTNDTAKHYVSGALVWMHGFSSLANEGLRVIDTNSVTGATSLSLTSATGAALSGVVPGPGFMSSAGYRITALNTTNWDVTANIGTLTHTGISTTLKALGLQPGQLVHFGSVAEVGGTPTRGLKNTGYARVRNLDLANSAIFDKLDLGIQADHDPATADLIDIVFGTFLKPVNSDDDLFAELPHYFEVGHLGLDNRSAQFPADFIYSKGNYCNTLGINLPLTDKATMSVAYIGTDTDPPAAQVAGASAAVSPKRTEAYNTTADIARLRIAELDDTGITTDFKSLTLSINNNVSPEKVLRKLGARFMNTGEFAISIEAQVLFTSGAVIAAIRNNATVSMDFILKNNDGILGFDIPGMTIGGGNRDYPENESVLINTTCETFEDEVFKSSMGMSFIPVPLP